MRPKVVQRISVCKSEASNWIQPIAWPEILLTLAMLIGFSDWLKPHECWGKRMVKHNEGVEGERKKWKQRKEGRKDEL